MNTLSFNINNGRTLKLIQRENDGKTLIHIEDQNGNMESIPDNEAFISADDMVMLVNYFRNCKTGKEKSDYIK
jgi:hypothetical protein